MTREEIAAARAAANRWADLWDRARGVFGLRLAHRVMDDGTIMGRDARRWARFARRADERFGAAVRRCIAITRAERQAAR